MTTTETSIPMTTEVRYHPELVENYPVYEKIEDFEEGCLEELGAKYLLRYGMEKDTDPKAQAHFRSRQERLRNDNFVKQYLRLHIGHLSQPMTLSGVLENDKLKNISKDATGFGWSYNQAFRERLKLFIRDGRVATLIDSPAETALTEGEAKANKEQSYEIIYCAEDILDWGYFDEGPRRGELAYVVFPYKPYTDGQDVFRQFRKFTQPPAPGARYVCETLRAKLPGGGDATPSKSAKIEVTVAASVTGGTDGIPVVIIGDGPEHSFVRDIVMDNCAHMNMQSVHDNVLWYGGMQKHMFTGVTREELDKWSEAAGIITSSQDAQVFTISPVYPQGLIEALRGLEVRIHRRGKFQFNQLADDTRQVQSAQSKHIDEAVRKDIYDETLDLFTEGERRIWQWHARFEQVDPETISVSIARDYGFNDSEAEDQKKEALWNKSRELGAIGIQRQILKSDIIDMPLVVSEGENEDDVRKALLDEIDALQTPSTQATARVSGFGASLFGQTPPDGNTNSGA